MPRRVRAFRPPNHAHSVHLVPPSAGRSRARRKRALLHALHLPLLRARQTQACCQSARREIAAKTVATAFSASRAPLLRSPPSYALLPDPCGRPATVQRGKEVWQWRGPPLRLRALAHPPALKAHYGDLVLSIGPRVRLQGDGLVAGMLSPLVLLWNATFKEKAAGGRSHFGELRQCSCGGSPVDVLPPRPSVSRISVIAGVPMTGASYRSHVFGSDDRAGAVA